jgi:hypothetical protein
MIEGRKVGYATNVSGSEEVQYDPLEVLDNIEVEEFVPVAYRATFTASLVRISGETVKSMGWFPKTGNDPEIHLRNILDMGEMVAVIEDTKTGNKIATAEQLKMQSRNFTVNARGMVGKDVTFVTARMRDESEV